MRDPTAVLAPLLPGQDHTALLHVCLGTGADAAVAWKAWRAAGRDLGSVLRAEPGLKPLAPLLHHALRANAHDVDRATLTVLRTASAREELRSAALEQVTAEVLGALLSSHVLPIVTGGAALAASAYPSPTLRHCHDLELLVGQEALGVAATALMTALSAGRRVSNGDTVTITHPSGVDVRLRSRLLTVGYYEPSISAIRARATPLRLAGAAVRTLSPPDMLLHVCAAAAYRAQPAALTWAADAWFTILRWPDLNWAVLVDTALASHLELLLATTLSYMAHELGAPIPPAALERLAEAAAHADTASRHLALSRAWVARHQRGGPRPQPRMSARDVLTWTRFALLPAPGYLLTTGRARRPASLPAAYLTRPIRNAGRLFRRGP